MYSWLKICLFFQNLWAINLGLKNFCLTWIPLKCNSFYYCMQWLHCWVPTPFPIFLHPKWNKYPLLFHMLTTFLFISWTIDWLSKMNNWGLVFSIMVRCLSLILGHPVSSGNLGCSLAWSVKSITYLCLPIGSNLPHYLEISLNCTLPWSACSEKCFKDNI